MYIINFKFQNRYLDTICIKFISFKNIRMKQKFSYRIYHKVFHEKIQSSISLKDASYYKPLLTVSNYSVQYHYQKKVLRKYHCQFPKFVPKPASDSTENALSHKYLINCLQKCESVAQQIKVFHSTVKLSDEDISQRHSICLDLEKILQPYFIDSLQLVGSSINGLGVRGCDVDLSLQISDMNAKHLLTDEELLYCVKLSSCSMQIQLLSTLQKIFRDLKFQEAITLIPGRHCPILNFYFKNLSCDLAINNSSALHSTNLMLLCGKLDERVAPIMQIIIYWAKRSKLIGGPVKFKSYSVFLLVIYFLQTRNPPVLPTVETMFERTDFMKNLKNWSYDVGKFVDKFELSKNVQTVEELLREFFFFYYNFNFSYIICPLHGTVIDSKTFASNIDCKNSFEINTVSIQDPLNCAWNVTARVNFNICKSFFIALFSVCEIYQDQSYWIPGHGNWGLGSLIESKFSYHTIKDIKELSINVPLVAVTDSFVHSDIQDLLVKSSENIRYIFKDCLLFECHLVDSSIDLSSLNLPQNVRTVIQNNFFSNICENQAENIGLHVDSFKRSEFVVNYICAARDTWKYRSAFNSVFSDTENVLYNEHTLSKIILEKDSSEKKLFYFLCECHLEDNICLHIKLKSLNSDRFIPQLGIFLKEYIPKYMDILQHDYLNKKEKFLK